MEFIPEQLEKLAHGSDAVFATDTADRIILWNKECESLLVVSARRAMGRRCYEILCGRDRFGNVYCHANCAVAFQAREKGDDPVRRFPLVVKKGDGTTRRISSAMFSIPSYHRALATLVHVLKPAVEESAAAVAPVPEPLSPVAGHDGDMVALTSREREVLEELSHGASTPQVARKLGIAGVTVRNHIQSILQKLEVHSKLEAVVLAHQRHLI